MTDIVERLREAGKPDGYGELYWEAAEEIERLRAAIITQGAEIDRICEFSLADRAEIERLRAMADARGETIAKLTNEREQNN